MKENRKNLTTMKNIARLTFAAMLAFAFATQANAEVYKYEANNSNESNQKISKAAGCSPSSTYAWLTINNVKARINAGGDMWWDLPGGTGSKYYVPSNGSATSLYAGSLWIGGLDINKQLKCAAIRFRQIGNDYWTGPLSLDGEAAVKAETCSAFDKIWQITRAEVDEFIEHYNEETHQMDFSDGYVIPKSITDWPAHADEYHSTNDTTRISHYLAPFFDRGGDGHYDPEEGDYPYYDIDNSLCHSDQITFGEEYEGSMAGSILADQVIKGDQTLWWVFNDKGNSHTESQGAAIGLEIRAQAFAFATNDEINNMTFYSYEIINRSTYALTGTYFSPWTDVDLGYAYDDFVGCDVDRGLGYGYNGSDYDGQGQTEAYGDQPPAVGVDFFQGPYLDPDGCDNPAFYGDGVAGPAFNLPGTPKNDLDCSIVTNDGKYMTMTYGDGVNAGDQVGTFLVNAAAINGVNFGNGIVDDERFGMRRFVYHNNSSSGVNSDPDIAAEYYNYLRGIWKNGEKMMYGGTAVPNAAGTVGPECDFMFPGDTDPCNWGTKGKEPNGIFANGAAYWTEMTGNAGNPNDPGDRRFMQSAGPFTLQPGAVNYITFGVPWARATSGGAAASVDLLRTVDDKCQSLFDNCFKVIDGPNAPDITIRELDRKLIIYLSNSVSSNNYKEGYVELDPEIPEIVPGSVDPTENPTGTDADRYYRFEGYKIYQLANASVSVDELNDNDKARLIFQCDIKNGVNKLVNFEYDESIGAAVPSVKVDGSDAGVSHSFVVSQDKFSNNTDISLVNFQTYYFMAIAYAYNNYLDYKVDPADPNALNGQQKPYLEGRKNIKIYSAIPHKTIDGAVVGSQYGSSPEITRIMGTGNGGNELELTEASIDEIMSKPAAKPQSSTTGDYSIESFPMSFNPTYKAGFGPIDIKVIDPLNVKPADYKLWFDGFETKYVRNVTGNVSLNGDSAAKEVSHWIMSIVTEDGVADTIYSDSTTILADEKLLLDCDGINYGISVNITQQFPIGLNKVGTMYSTRLDNEKSIYQVIAPENGMITSSVIYSDSSNKWLGGIADEDTPGQVLNWIRSGSHADQDNQANNDRGVIAGGSSDVGASKPMDPDENYEHIADRTWAPYYLAAASNPALGDPAPVLPNSYEQSYFPRLSSIDIVLTSDTSKWTRCPMVEMCGDPELVNGIHRFHLRDAASIDKNGQPCESKTMGASANLNDANYIASNGMTWFPGYAIDIESGARLNMIVGEDSYLADLNGRDMAFNPPTMRLSTYQGTSLPTSDPAIFRQVSGEAVMGGKHFVYIFGIDNATVTTLPNIKYHCPAYDAGQYLYDILQKAVDYDPAGPELITTAMWKQCLWVGMPMPIEGRVDEEALKNGGNWIPEGNDCKIRIRLAKPYDKSYIQGFNDIPSSLYVNNLNPMYTFSTKSMAVKKNDPAKTETDLDLVNIVPNPYYAHSYYEDNALINKVKITNLPYDCTVTIYTISGTKVRQFKKTSEVTYIDWDLTNHASTPIASGFYLIHVKDNTSGGERILKFYGAMRQVDLNTF